MNLVMLLRIAGLLHFGLLLAGSAMPRAVKLRAHLAPLPQFIRRLFWVYYSFIGLCLFSFGIITVICAGELAQGGPMERAFCVFLAVFWTLRLVVAGLVFDVRPYLTGGFYRAGYWATNFVFIYLPVVYAWAAWK